MKKRPGRTDMEVNRSECGICGTRRPYDLPISERMKQIAQEMG